ncbi:PTS system beta-glucosides-specific IIC component [Paenibacillus sp. SORGH_AS306]|uniref:beta-glucoside-specific PTS transporter subunit IIABC n=1 Tax=unclassified Paenibacillus TaxID=185978 RepID=UPI0027809F3D|nr:MULTISPECIES: beta-glucoside-specific PTS transporter subunit IIABC [unclassified Paenibacillus]MDQ1233926.1 PTS system beta-glucosides-specific IIC component [Paenibacillus sp. SORGH_AS_0306]MDR6110971.1 PTS system beta-glucosides-specific IIC component [Paenibacillus sp. SORGH_AS_0338]
MDKEKLSQDILDLVGGTSNIDQVTHCMTRLRFNLNDDNLANKAQLEKTPGVMGVMKNGGQFQVIIGNEVANVYKELVKKIPGAGQLEETASTKPKKKQNPISTLFDFISGMFTPILPAITGAGMIKGIVAILVALGWMSNTSSTYIILSAIGDGAFYFLPIILAISASRKLGSNMYIGAALGAAIMHPTITALLSSGQSVTFASIPVVAATYSSTVIPIVIAIWIASYVEKAVDRYTHVSLKLLVVPTVTLLVMVPLTLIAIGPLGSIIGSGLSGGIAWLFENMSIVASILIGGTMSLLIITGMHYALTPIVIGSITALGYDFIIPLMFAANWAQAGGALGVGLRSKNAQTKSLGFSTGLTAIMGITEPAMYGINMKFKKPFIAALIGGAIGGAFMGIFHVKSYVITGLVGLPSVAAFISPSISTLIYALLGGLIALVSATAITYFIGVKESSEEAETTQATANEVNSTPVASNTVAASNVIDIHQPAVQQVIAADIFSPVAGEVKPLSAVNDPAFSQEIMGKGVAIEPTEGRIVSPVNGTVFSVSKSGHAIGLVSDTGTEMLIHIGIDTVKLKGKHFTPHAKAGETVKIGDLLMEFDLKAVREEGYETITPVIVTNINDYNNLQSSTQSNTRSGELLYKLS